MIYLIYVSSAVRPMNDTELLALLRQSQENNKRLGITGMLLYKGGNFMQVLEGPKEAVLKLHEKIGKDPRHKNVITLLQRPLEERLFPNWSMGFQNIDQIDPADMPGFSDFLREPLIPEAFVNDLPSALKLLVGFKKRMR